MPLPRQPSKQEARPTPSKIQITNAFGLLSKFGTFQHRVKSLFVAVDIITEAKLIPNIPVPKSSIPGFYSPICFDHTAQRGDVTVWNKFDLTSEHLYTVPCRDHGAICISLRLRTGKGYHCMYSVPARVLPKNMIRCCVHSVPAGVLPNKN